MFSGNLRLVVYLLILIVLITVSYKHGLVNTLIFQCFKICSSYENLHNKIVYPKKFFKRNRYPNDLVDRCIKKFFYKLYITKNIYQTVEKKQLLIILPFSGHLSFETKNTLNSCIRNQKSATFSFIKNCITVKNRLSSLFKFKDSIPKYLCPYLIYRFLCSCSNATYYGEIERHLFVRALEHLKMTH